MSSAPAPVAALERTAKAEIAYYESHYDAEVLSNKLPPMNVSAQPVPAVAAHSPLTPLMAMASMA